MSLDRRVASPALVAIDFSGERDVGDLREGHFTQTVVGMRVRLNVSPDYADQQLRAVRHRQRNRSARIRELRWTFRRWPISS